MTDCTHPLGHEWVERVFTVEWDLGAFHYGLFRFRTCVRCAIAAPTPERDLA